MKIKVLLFGGTFNPIHHGHLILAQHVIGELNFAKTVFIPSARPALKDIDISFGQRVTMTTLAITGNMDFKISEIENEIDGTSYTLETIRRIKKSEMFDIGEYEFYWLIGPDNLESLKDWYKIDELVEECSFVLGVWDGDKDSKPFIPLSALFSKEVPDHCRWFRSMPQFKDYPFYEKLDKNMTVVSIPNIDIRSTIIRDKVAKGQSIKYLTPLMVERYINNYGLYKITKQQQVVSCESGEGYTGA